jgi:outer membrane usher protein
VSQEQVAPGRLDVRNLPLTIGRNDASIVVRDAFGASREISGSYYLANSVLAPGLHEYHYSLGFRREAPGATSWGYKEAVALARHRVGVTDTVTAGGRVELSSRLLSLGPSFNFRLPVGEIEAAAAASAGPDSRGGAALASYSFTGRPFGAGASLMKATPGYTVTSARPAAERPSVEGSVFGSVSIGSRLSVTGQHSQASLHGGAVRARSAAFATVYLSRPLQLGASAGRVRNESGVSREFYVGATLSLGRTSAAASVVRTPTGSGAVIEAQQPLPVGTGYGYQARAETTTPGHFSGALRYQNRYGRYELRQDTVGGTSMTGASVMGSVVAIGGAVYASRPVEQSFALVRVPGVEGVRGYASNQEVGRTDKKGNLLIPDLQPYYGNLLTIADTDIPLEYSVGGVRLTLAPPFRGGALGLFPVQSVRRVLGRVRVSGDGGDRTPEFGEIIVAAEGMPPVTSPLGAEGDFYFENLPPGRHAATVRDDKGECSFILDVPDSTDEVIRLAVLRCVSPEAP